MKYCFVFVCQQGDLEFKALTLAASLARNLRCAYELVAAVPSPESIWGVPAAQTLSLLGAFGARVAQIENPFGLDYPIGNKLVSLGIASTADKIVFLDSDMLCLAPFAGDVRFEHRRIHAKPADFATYAATRERWQSAYAACGLHVPEQRVAATVSGELMPPYFNAGFIAVDRQLDFANTWLECARAIDADASVPDKRPWLDQIALPIAAAKLDLRIDCLDERYNHPTHVKPIDPDRLPFFCHYHSVDVLRREPAARALVQSLAAGCRELKAVLEQAAGWKALLEPYRLSRPRWPRPVRFIKARTAATARAPRLPHLLVTGIPRSGTSYLCALLNSVRNCVVINEPTRAIPTLVEAALPWSLATFHRDLRRDVLEGRPIENKLHRGEFISDTASIDQREVYCPQVDRVDFVLGSKNTLAYMARLSELRRVMPGAVMVACIRHPLDTIASWKATFSHLAQADLESQQLGHSRDLVLSGWRRHQLEQIASTESLAERRALMWRYLADVLLEHREHLVLLHYEALVANPAVALRRIFDALPATLRPRLGARPEASRIKHRREVLDEADFAAIAGICGQIAASFGYDS